jgi:putative nucleotidyltransferase with HDIG domain
MSVAHLAKRFFTSLRPRPVDDADLAFVKLTLTPTELAEWEQLSRADKAESLATARRAAHALGPDADDTWLAVALLHDVGKTDSHLGTFGRAGATMIAGVVSHGRARHYGGPIGRYVSHDDLGAARLRAAGARTEAVAWAEAHHRRELWDRIGIPLEICEILSAADGE